MTQALQWEQLSQSISICVTPEHKFGTDAFLLAHFSQTRHKDRVCDLGTGCGIIPLLLARDAKPKQIDAVDIQPQAIEQLKQSLTVSQLDTPIFPHTADLNELSMLKAGQYDVVTCNPPYKAEGAGILSEGNAQKIARHESLCTITDVCQSASRLLKFGGKLCLCQRPERLADVLCAMRNAQIEPKRLRFVSKNAEGAPWLFLVEGKKGSQPFLTVEKPLYVYDGTQYSKEMAEIYGWDAYDTNRY